MFGRGFRPRSHSKGPTALTFKGLPLDELEDAIPTSPASRQAARILAPEPTVIGGRPLTPLHAGQVGLVACSGLINGIFGTGEERHIIGEALKAKLIEIPDENNSIRWRSFTMARSV